MKKQYSTLTALVLASLFGLAINVQTVQAETTAETKPGITIGKIDPADLTKVTYVTTIEPADSLYGTDYTKQTSYNALSVTGMTADNPLLGDFTAAGYLDAADTGSGTDAKGDNNNTVTITNTDMTDADAIDVGSIYGGYVTGNTQDTLLTANGNTVTITDDRLQDVYLGSVVGGYTDAGEASGNTVQLTGAYIDKYNNIYIEEDDDFVAGGQTKSGNAHDNHVTLTNADASTVYGGQTSSGNAYSNHVTIKEEVSSEEESDASGYVDTLYGGQTDSGNAYDNHVTLTNAEANTVYGGQTNSGNAYSNDVTINAGAAPGTVYGGFAGSGSIPSSNGGGMVELMTVSLTASLDETATVAAASDTTLPEKLTLSAYKNTVTLNQGSEISDAVYGGAAALGLSSEDFPVEEEYVTNSNLSLADSLTANGTETTGELSSDTANQLTTVSLSAAENEVIGTQAAAGAIYGGAVYAPSVYTPFVPASIAAIQYTDGGANSNTVTLTNMERVSSTFGGYVVNGAQAANLTANANQVKITGDENGQGSWYGTTVGGFNTFGEAANNYVTITGTLLSYPEEIAALQVQSTAAGTQKVPNIGLTTVYGGAVESGSATENHVSITNASASGDLYGGAAGGSVSDLTDSRQVAAAAYTNTTSTSDMTDLLSSSLVSAQAIPSYVDPEGLTSLQLQADKNTVQASSTTVSGSVYGGAAGDSSSSYFSTTMATLSPEISIKADGNTVTLDTNTTIQGSVYGGYAGDGGSLYIPIYLYTVQTAADATETETPLTTLTSSQSASGNKVILTNAAVTSELSANFWHKTSDGDDLPLTGRVGYVLSKGDVYGGYVSLPTPDSLNMNSASTLKASYTLQADHNAVGLTDSPVAGNVVGGFIGTTPYNYFNETVYDEGNTDATSTSAAVDTELQTDTLTIATSDLLGTSLYVVSTGTNAESLAYTLSANNNTVKLVNSDVSSFNKSFLEAARELNSSISETATVSPYSTLVYGGNVIGGYVSLGSSSLSGMTGVAVSNGSSAAASLLATSLVETTSASTADTTAVTGTGTANTGTIETGANHNTVTLINSAVTGAVVPTSYGDELLGGNVYGGYVDFVRSIYMDSTNLPTLSANDNHVTISYQKDATAAFAQVGGGQSFMGDASGNTVGITGKTVTADGETAPNVTISSAFGGSAFMGSADNNSVALDHVDVANPYLSYRYMPYGYSMSSPFGETAGVIGGAAYQGSMSPLETPANATASASNNQVVLIDSSVTTYAEEMADLPVAASGISIIGGYAYHDYAAELAADTTAYTASTHADGNRISLVRSQADTVLGGIAIGISDVTVAEDEAVSLTEDAETPAYKLSLNVSANDNLVQLTDSTVTNIIGAMATAGSTDQDTAITYTNTETANNNRVTLSGSTATQGIIGAIAATGTAAENQVYLGQGSQAESVFGGFSAAGNAQGNQTVLSGSTSKNVFGGYTLLGTATGNTVSLANSQVDVVYGGGTGNTGLDAIQSIMMSMAQAPIFMAGPSAMPTSGGMTASGNTVNISGGTVGSVWGGYAQDATITTYKIPTTDPGTMITVSDSLEASLVQQEGTGTLVPSTLETETITYKSGDASNNTVNLYSGTITGTITGGQSDSGAANNNTVNLYGGTLDKNVSLYGGVSSVESKGNTLNVYSKGNSVTNLGGFQTINFYIAPDAVAGDTMLTVTGNADVDGVIVQAGISDAVKLNVGQLINVAVKDTTSTTEDTSTTDTASTAGTLRKMSLKSNVVTTPTTTSDLTKIASLSMISGMDIVMDDAFIQHKVEIRRLDDNTIVLEIPEDDVPTINPDTKLFAEDRAAAINNIHTASDFAATNAYDGALMAWNDNSEVKEKFTPYLVVGGHDLRADTGSYIDTYGFNANLGFVNRTYQKDYTDTFMPFLEYGNGNYTSHLDDGARGDGNQHYVGAGLLARRDLNNGFHYEAMVHAGKITGDFHGLIHGHMVSYDSSATYVSAMAGAGKIVKKDKDSFDFYGKLFWTHLASDAVQTHSDQGTSQYNLDAVNSYRTRLGFRWTKDLDATSSVYAGLAWNYEFGDNAKARYSTFETPTAGVKGSSALLEIGWQSKITKNHPWGADIKLTGWTGVQRGATYSATISRAF
ncbi:autotransporter outer membrane beta-barrel domain-containing protein [Megasphaera hominis]|uniref:Autotransporter outer membrane beta-barrel domain-containing protein n=1 Tax=Megasphaera hominis TaxID=159836 RepID=A0ABR6VHB6_9FIRM|nr:autotransporter outer membrane beta-barrel domain-containing protein [Megasphaera hominis]MBC3536697.1 autotransporter outer membrane beta-barrel domain-containing protein [Megasphaera hominis]